MIRRYLLRTRFVEEKVKCGRTWKTCWITGFKNSKGQENFMSNEEVKTCKEPAWTCSCFGCSFLFTTCPSPAVLNASESIKLRTVMKDKNLTDKFPAKVERIGQ